MPDTTTRPTEAEMEAAMSVLAWLHGFVTDGRTRDDISHARFILDAVIEGETDA